eukprot:TRINITY_DN1581_c0_g1_i10.p2 TRINITY_DN1581_c0_g1~~TRINITY_DN1581_c0_g1_i10.p2  ORF type:complete len:133 (-),score=22.75 TRINITY_DN1581_c0_g1_i10:725-1075(-)
MSNHNGEVLTYMEQHGCLHAMPPLDEVILDPFAYVPVRRVRVCCLHPPSPIADSPILNEALEKQETSDEEEDEAEEAGLVLERTFTPSCKRRLNFDDIIVDQLEAFEISPTDMLTE